MREIQAIHPELSEYSLKLLNAYSDVLEISREFNEDSEFRVKLRTKVSGWFEDVDGRKVLLSDQSQDIWTLDNREDCDALISLLSQVRDDAFPEVIVNDNA